MMESDEIWLPAAGFEEFYWVSSKGNVRREATGRGARVGRILKATIDGRGYRMVDLFSGAAGTRQKRKVHILVAATFLGPRPADLEVRHLDGNRLNNAVENLRYGSRSENMMDAVKHGTHSEARKMSCKRGHPFTPDNTRIESTGSRRCLTCKNARRPKGKAA